jgi:small subunit ribosomal protein S2
MREVSMQEMLEAGVHFGHQTHRWNPKMASFIFTEKNGVHIFDLAQTEERLNKALNFVSDIAAKGGVVLFVGTKKQAKAIIKEEAIRCDMPFINDRWLGGLLTNFSTILGRITYFKKLKERKESGDLNKLSKKENAYLCKELDKLEGYLGGIKDLKKLPDALFVIDTHKESLAVKEANRLKIPVIGVVDTNANPDDIDFIIPGNDDAIKSVRYLSSILADAIIAGRGLTKDNQIQAQIKEA